MLDALVEFFSLRHASAALSRCAPEARDLARTRALVGRQKALAARDLWGAEQPAEATRLARAALAESLAAARAATALDDDDAALAALGLGPDDVAQVLAARDAPPSPELDGGFDDLQRQRFGDVTAAWERVDARVAPLASSGDELRALRVSRVTLALAAVLCLVAAGARSALKEGRTATASAHLLADQGFPPSRVLDGDEGAEWVLPLGQTGWVDVLFEKPRALRAVRVLNAHNRTHNDLATHEYRVEAFAGPRLAGSARGAFAGIDPRPQWTRVPLAASGVTRVRVWIDSFHGAAGGLAELDFE